MSGFARRSSRRGQLSTGEKRFLLREPEGPTPDDPIAAKAWWRERKLEARSRIKRRPIVRLLEDGVSWGVRPGPDDEIGFGMRPHGRADDCLQVAIATVTQIPVEDVPALDLRDRVSRGEDPEKINESAWATIASWAEGRSLEVLLWGHDELPVPRNRWIGVVPGPSAPTERRTRDPQGGVTRLVVANNFSDHCLVMAEDRLIFDPSVSCKPPPGHKPLHLDPVNIAYGISIERKD